MYVARSKQQEGSWLLTYILLLFTSAIVRDFIITPFVAQHIHGVGAILVEPIWKVLTWLAPTWLYIKFVEGQNPLSYLKLTQQPLKGLAWGLYGCFFLTALEFGNLLRNHTFHSPGANTWVNVIILIGLMEEIPFRGLLFQKLQSWFGLVGSMLLSSMIFALIHLPLWLSTGQSASGSLLLGMMLVFIVGIVACVVLKLSGSLWSCIFAHTFYNVLTSIF